MLNRVLFIFSLIFFLFYNSITFAHTDVRRTALPGTVSLTFDDGPNPIDTPKILAILKKNHIRATFFMVGANAAKYPELVKQVLADGHVIANHSWTHPFLTKISDVQLQHEVLATQAILLKITGKKSICLRPPFGASNAHVLAYIRSQDITPVRMGWNSFDYDRPGVDKIIANVVNYAHSGQVFLMHDGYARREQTVAALQKIIDDIRKKGLGFSALCG